MKTYQTYLLDLDGVIYRGDLLLPGAQEFIAWMEETGKRYRYLTNNPMIGPPAVAAKLSRLGIPTTAAQVVTASQAAVHMIARRRPGARCWIVALPPIRQMAVAAGLHVLNLHYGDAPDEPHLGPESAQIVLVGLDRALT